MNIHHVYSSINDLKRQKTSTLNFQPQILNKWLNNISTFLALKTNWNMVTFGCLPLFVLFRELKLQKLKRWWEMWKNIGVREWPLTRTVPITNRAKIIKPSSAEFKNLIQKFFFKFQQLNTSKSFGPKGQKPITHLS